MNKNVHISIIFALILIGGVWYSSSSKNDGSSLVANTALAAKFDILSKNGNSSCSGVFNESIDGMSNTAQLQGSCCSMMDMHRYEEQVNGLTQFKDIPEIPSDPYDIYVGFTKNLQTYL